eukprot:SM000205S06220  [mRNA]  locus=s205:135454:140322:+ [translate_table: standard]
MGGVGASARSSHSSLVDLADLLAAGLDDGDGGEDGRRRLLAAAAQGERRDEGGEAEHKAKCSTAAALQLLSAAPPPLPPSPQSPGAWRRKRTLRRRDLAAAAAAAPDGLQGGMAAVEEELVGRGYGRAEPLGNSERASSGSGAGEVREACDSADSGTVSLDKQSFAWSPENGGIGSGPLDAPGWDQTGRSGQQGQAPVSGHIGAHCKLLLSGGKGSLITERIEAVAAPPKPTALGEMMPAADLADEATLASGRCELPELLDGDGPCADMDFFLAAMDSPARPGAGAEQSSGALRSPVEAVASEEAQAACATLSLASKRAASVHTEAGASSKIACVDAVLTAPTDRVRLSATKPEPGGSLAQEDCQAPALTAPPEPQSVESEMSPSTRSAAEAAGGLTAVAGVALPLAFSELDDLGHARVMPLPEPGSLLQPLSVQGAMGAPFGPIFPLPLCDDGLQAMTTPRTFVLPARLRRPHGLPAAHLLGQFGAQARQRQLYKHLKRNIIVHRTHKVVSPDEAPVCECSYIEGDAGSACSEDRCINALLSTEVKVVATDDGRGFGLVAAQDIKAGQFMLEYCGEVITDKEAIRRSEAYAAEGEKNHYILQLSGTEFVDATKKGGLARFGNHSCAPNCETRKWNVLGEVRVGIFAKYNIPAGAELSYDYNFEWFGGEKRNNPYWEDGEDRYHMEDVPTYDSGDEDHKPPIATVLGHAMGGGSAVPNKPVHHVPQDDLLDEEKQLLQRETPKKKVQARVARSALTTGKVDLIESPKAGAACLPKDVVVEVAVVVAKKKRSERRRSSITLDKGGQGKKRRKVAAVEAQHAKRTKGLVVGMRPVFAKKKRKAATARPLEGKVVLHSVTGEEGAGPFRTKKARFEVQAREVSEQDDLQNLHTIDAAARAASALASLNILLRPKVEAWQRSEQPGVLAGSSEDWLTMRNQQLTAALDSHCSILWHGMGCTDYDRTCP